MPVVVTCPACQRKARVPRAALGKTVRCPSCGTNFAASKDNHPPLPAEVVPEDSSELRSDSGEPINEPQHLERIGVGLLTISEAFFAISMALQLCVNLIGMLPADPGPKNPSVVTVTQVMNLIAVLALAIGTVSSLVGAVVCSVPPAALAARVAAGSLLVLTLLIVLRAPSGGVRDLVSLLTPPVYLSARQAMLAIYARVQAQRLGDAATASMAGALALGYPVVVIGLATLAILVTMFSGKPHPTFDQATRTIDQLAQTVLVAWSAFILWRVLNRLRVSE